MYEKKILDLIKKLEDERALLENTEEQLDQAKKLLADQHNSMQELKNMAALKAKFRGMHQLYESSQAELQSLELEYNDILQGNATLNEELNQVKRRLLVEEKQRKSLKHELAKLRKIAPETDNDFDNSRARNLAKQIWPLLSQIPGSATRWGFFGDSVHPGFEHSPHPVIIVSFYKS